MPGTPTASSHMRHAAPYIPSAAGVGSHSRRLKHRHGPRAGYNRRSNIVRIRRYVLDTRRMCVELRRWRRRDVGGPSTAGRERAMGAVRRH